MSENLRMMSWDALVEDNDALLAENRRLREVVESLRTRSREAERWLALHAEIDRTAQLALPAAEDES